MKVLNTRALASGLAGACVLTLLHEGQRRALPHAPRLDLLGMRAIAKALTLSGLTPPAPDGLRATALAGDLAANTVYYSLVGLTVKRPILTGGLLGLAAGVAAVLAPEPLSLGNDTTRRTPQMSAMTIVMHSIAGMTAGAAYSALTTEAWPEGEWGDAFFP